MNGTHGGDGDVRAVLPHIPFLLQVAEAAVSFMKLPIRRLPAQ
jgi:hypothetical protein